MGLANLVGWLVDWGLTSHQQLRSYGDGTSVYSPIRRTGEARDRTCDPWFTRRVTYPLHHGGFLANLDKNVNQRAFFANKINNGYV